MSDAGALVNSPPFAGYSYAYPHKTAYRPLPRPLPLDEIWQPEDRSALFLYLHVPFCEHRCGFCNLFTQAHPRAGATTRYLEALERQAARVARAIAPGRFARMAIGGGTPTLLDNKELERVFAVAESLGAAAKRIPCSVELSPETATEEKIALLRERGVSRVSIGVETLDEREARNLSRPQKRATVEAALGRLRAAGFPTMNVDLIYGIGGQTIASLLDSIRGLLEYRPEELFLYPLYVRPLTGLGLAGRSWDDDRLAMQRAARDLLTERGYHQTSMRMFRAAHAPAQTGPSYCCQADGMVGLGAGARSYSSSIHYSTEWAVGRSGVSEILEDFMTRDDRAHDHATHGFLLDEGEQKRRWLIQSLLQTEGFDLSRYQARFGTSALADFPELTGLGRAGLAKFTEQTITLTDAGLERSDAIGPWLYSPEVRRLMSEHALR